ncbi:MULTISPECIES: toprim domain-containing protein [unclassified Acetobacterium]|uniref:toprim domain-containing protein n=1 Tax=unclassified Acetobacterium TaxID=2638182 RepID=UPI00210F5175|nr:MULTISPECIES: toprim domain-containing protein [unclassified Acetobacterium]MDZ5726382.1 toprim domain-containing protein [Acetobacterium sp. K1/6]
MTQNKGDHYIALNGVAHIGLIHYLKTHPEIEHIVTCLDNDEPGHKNTLELINAVEEVFPGKYNFDLKIPPEPHKDWNQLLVSICQERENAALQTEAEDEWEREA